MINKLWTLAGNISGNAALPDSNKGGVNSLARFLTLLVIFIFVLAVTYFTTHFVAKSQRGIVRAANMEICETLQLAPGRYLQIVRVGEKYYLIGTGKDNVSFMTELDQNLEFADKTLPGFSEILDKFKKKKEEDG
ncbi:MAG: flagellar biosynthetic protein FliO [Lachnospiraceae bacterium]|nr:flagellar biosynthetic protein FliO [Lachnospiraceae bacterium]